MKDNCLWLKGFGGMGACAVKPRHRSVSGAVVWRICEICGLRGNSESPHGLQECIHRASRIKRANAAHTHNTAPWLSGITAQTHTNTRHERIMNKAPVMRGVGGNVERKKKNMPLAQPAKRHQDSGNKMLRITRVL